MQAQNLHTRGNGFIISPLAPPPSISRPKEYYPSVRKRKKIFLPLKEYIKNYFSLCLLSARDIIKSVGARTISLLVAICALGVFFNFFTFGTAVYHCGKIVAVTAAYDNFEKALSEANVFSKENGHSSYFGEFKTYGVIALKNNLTNGTPLRDKLLLCSPQFSSACTLYCKDTPVFSAENFKTAKEVVDGYILSNSINDNRASISGLRYEIGILPKDKVSGREECTRLLSQNEHVSAISVVNSLSKKELPFEVKSQPDSNLYVGETVTVSEGQVGSAQVRSETVYENGRVQLSRVISENVVTEPVAKIVRVGTKTKDVLKTGLYYPLEGVISSSFGKRWGRMHEGLDIAVEEGTPVIAAECGTVCFAGDGGTYGKLVRIDHGNGVITAYAHLSKINVSVGQAVNVNTQIALSGNTGRSTGPHLHFEVVNNEIPLNPDLYLKKR